MGMVMSIISSLFAIPLIVISGIGLGTSGYRRSSHHALMVPFVFCTTVDSFVSRHCCSYHSGFFLPCGMLRKTVKQWYRGILQCCTFSIGTSGSTIDCHCWSNISTNHIVECE